MPARLLLPATLAVVVFASRTWLIATWGSAVPFWDQWGAEGALYRAWLSDTLTWRDLVAPHNEHRIAFTRLADLVLFALSGGWNPWAQLLLNAALHAATAAAIGFLLLPTLAAGGRSLCALGLAVLFSATAGWQNALWGFQSQVYFTNLFAILAFAGLTATPFQPRWWFGLLALLLGFFSNAGGLLAAVTALLVAWPAPGTRRGWAGWTTVLAIVVLGLILHPTSPHHTPLQARSFGQFFAVFARGLGWPHVNSGWAWFVMLLPAAAFIGSYFRTSFHRFSDPAATTAGARNGFGITTATRLSPFSFLPSPIPAAPDRFALALVAFAVLQAAAVAYTRAAGLPEWRPLSRYQDPLILGAAGQLYLALRLASAWGRPGRLLLLGWSSVLLLGLLTLTTTNLSLNLPYKRATDAAALEQIRHYLKSGDRDSFPPNAYFAGPEGDVTDVIRVLNYPLLRPKLPAEFQGDVSRPWLIEHAGWLTLVAWLAFSLAMVHSTRNPAAETVCDDRRRTESPPYPRVR